MGNESRFSGEQIEYAVDMAQRMSYEILAMNSAPLSCDSFSLFSTSRNKLCQEFQSISESNASAFREAAETQGVPFTHVVKFDEPEQALHRPAKGICQYRVRHFRRTFQYRREPRIRNPKAP